MIKCNLIDLSENLFWFSLFFRVIILRGNTHYELNTVPFYIKINTVL